MNPAKLIEKLSTDGIHIRVDGTYLEVHHKNYISPETVQYLKQYKKEIIEHLQPVNQPRYHVQYTYRFILKNNNGGGTYITDCPPAEAKRELLNIFVGREIESMNLLN